LSCRRTSAGLADIFSAAGPAGAGVGKAGEAAGRWEAAEFWPPPGCLGPIARRYAARACNGVHRRARCRRARGSGTLTAPCLTAPWQRVMVWLHGCVARVCLRVAVALARWSRSRTSLPACPPRPWLPSQQSQIAQLIGWLTRSTPLRSIAAQSPSSLRAQLAIWLPAAASRTATAISSRTHSMRSSFVRRAAAPAAGEPRHRPPRPRHLPPQRRPLTPAAPSSQTPARGRACTGRRSSRRASQTWTSCWAAACPWAQSCSSSRCALARRCLPRCRKPMDAGRH
jgi:hypothetical protein